MEGEKDRLKYTISRLDHYYDSINNKTALYVAVNTFLTGAILTFVIQFKNALLYNTWLTIFLALIVFVGIWNLVLIAKVCIPYHPVRINSLYYFKCISSMSEVEFSDSSKKRKEKADIKDLRCQVHELSTGLTKKFIRLSVIGKLLIVQFVLLGPITLLIFKQLF